ncbi:hypothetical protein M947_01895 [Sulfurimonas hongkongensis]|uniref:Cyclic nucleotide-binding domain-containing protein n=1 Tax=Sulfurimonas hongkongensis TaxID=1172190 RepID=T0JHI9_9BACT|nr:Crp/Fnr family transcriptional regulator [Sulfurimonas hongkongensis]EQB40580.1 hypothetical protein M947_01895 [Sulfurimonas hongkongensis]
MQVEYPIDIVQSKFHQDVESYGRVLFFSKDEMVLTPQELTKKFFFVLEGRIKVSQVNLKNAKEQIITILTNGDMYDVVTLLDGKLHENLLYALDEVKIVCFPIEIVRKWMQEDQNFNKILFPYVSNQLREREELALDLSLYSVSERLIKLISKTTNHENPSKRNLLQNLSHEVIASIIGTVRKVLNRHIQQLKDDDMITVKRKNIEIKDAQKLLDSLPLS